MAGGTLVLRNEDLDPQRSKPEFVSAFIEDLKWLGCEWQEGPDLGGPCAPYDQSARIHLHRAVFDQLRIAGFVYPCVCSRKDILNTLAAPHEGEEEPVYPGMCRNFIEARLSGRKHCWRFRVPDGEPVEFEDGGFGPQRFVAGKDFGDFIIWRQDDAPSYQLAVVADDAAMGVTEVVRGADLLLSTARQLLLYKALGWNPPAFFHCPLVKDVTGQRLAKRHDALSLRALREAGKSPEELRNGWL